MSKTLIFNRVNDFCDRENLVSPGQTIIIGLSGGPDSVFLLYYFLSIQKKYNLTLHAVNIDHGWRAESAQDTEFCRQLCAAVGVPFVTKHMRDISHNKKDSGSAEDNARNARRSFFEECAQEYQADAIALAQHQDDLLETFFIRLVRGSGLTGLASIKPKNNLYIRPLLNITKKEILEYLDAHAISYCVDKTNQETSFLRNNIRHTLMPVYSALDTRAMQNLARTIEQLQETDSFLEKLTQDYYQALVKDGWLDAEKFLTLDPVIQHRILLHWIICAGVAFTPSEKFFAEIIRFLKQPESKTHAIAASWAIQKAKRKARIIPTLS